MHVRSMWIRFNHHSTTVCHGVLYVITVSFGFGSSHCSLIQTAVQQSAQGHGHVAGRGTLPATPGTSRRHWISLPPPYLHDPHLTERHPWGAPRPDPAGLPLQFTPGYAQHCLDHGLTSHRRRTSASSPTTRRCRNRILWSPCSDSTGTTRPSGPSLGLHFFNGEPGHSWSIYRSSRDHTIEAAGTPRTNIVWDWQHSIQYCRASPAGWLQVPLQQWRLAASEGKARNGYNRFRQTRSQQLLETMWANQMQDKNSAQQMMILQLPTRSGIRCTVKISLARRHQHTCS